MGASTVGEILQMSRQASVRRTRGVGTEATEQLAA